MKRKGYVQIYTGDGKGKTTAAIGLALRASGHGMRTCFCQFLKGQSCGEHTALSKIPEITLLKTGSTCFVRRDEITEAHKKEAREGLDQASRMMLDNHYDIVVLDEVNVAVFYHILSVEEVLRFIESKPDHVELILTGRRASKELMDRADLVTEMREIKHYYKAGVPAREGIES